MWLRSDWRGGFLVRAILAVGKIRSRRAYCGIWGFGSKRSPDATGRIDAELPEMSNHWWVNHKQTFARPVR